MSTPSSCSISATGSKPLASACREIPGRPQGRPAGGEGVESLIVENRKRIGHGLVIGRSCRKVRASQKSCVSCGFNRPAARSVAMMGVCGQRAVLGLNLTKLYRGVAPKNGIALAV